MKRATILLAFITFVGACFGVQDFNRDDLRLSVVLAEGQKSTAIERGAKYASVGTFVIKNHSPFAVNIKAVQVSSPPVMESAYLEDGNRLIEGRDIFTGDGWYFEIPVSMKIEASSSKEVTVRGSFFADGNDQRISSFAMYIDTIVLVTPNNSNFYYGLDIFDSWIQHSIVGELPKSTTVSNSSGLSTLGGASAYGFSISGDKFTKRKILVRIAGPALAKLGVTSALADPVVQVIDSQKEIVADNDDWPIGLEERFREVGAFPFVKGSYDSAVEVYLAPGSYTVRVKSANSSTGVYLIETYQLPEVLSSAQIIKYVKEEVSQVGEKG
jgi:hypothetical protein